VAGSIRKHVRSLKRTRQKVMKNLAETGTPAAALTPKSGLRVDLESKLIQNLNWYRFKRK